MFGQVERHHGLEHGNLDELALPGFLAVVKGRDDRIGGDLRAGLVGHDRRHVARLADQHRHQLDAAALALDHIVVGRRTGIRPAGQIAVQAGIDDAIVAREHRFMTEAEAGDRLRPDRMDEHVGAIDQPPQRVARRGLLQIEDDGALVAVYAHEQRRHVAGPRRTGVAGGVARRRLDLDHVGAEIAQDLGRQRAEHDRAQIQHANAVKRSGHRLSRSR